MSDDKPNPEGPVSVDAVLARVPELACELDFDACLVPSDRLQDATGGAPAQIDAVATPDWIAQIRQRLTARRGRAQGEDQEQIVFLCDCLAHFLAELPAREHPLVIALYLRSLAKRDRLETDHKRLGLAMDQYSAMLAREQRTE